MRPFLVILAVGALSIYSYQMSSTLSAFSGKEEIVDADDYYDDDYDDDTGPAVWIGPGWYGGYYFGSQNDFNVWSGGGYWDGNRWNARDGNYHAGDHDNYSRDGDGQNRTHPNGWSGDDRGGDRGGDRGAGGGDRGGGGGRGGGGHGGGGHGR